MGLSILLRLLPRPLRQWIAVAMVLLMLVSSPVLDWVVDRYISLFERRIDRVTEHMEDAPYQWGPNAGMNHAEMEQMPDLPPTMSAQAVTSSRVYGRHRVNLHKEEFAGFSGYGSKRGGWSGAGQGEAS